MKKVLIVVAHPHIEQSVINKRWIEELKQYPERFTVHELYKAYPDGKIDVAKEQALIEAHDSLILQFPVYWFNCTPLLKQWFDDVFTYGWAYGSKGHKFKNRKVGLAISLGSDEENYIEPYTVESMLLPFEMTLKYVEADYRSAFTLYGANTELEKATITSQKIEQSDKDYIEFLNDF